MKLIMVLDLFIKKIKIKLNNNNNKTNLIITIVLNLFLIKKTNIITEVNTTGGISKGNKNKTEQKRPTVKFTLIDKNSE